MFNAAFDFGELRHPVRIIGTGDWHISKKWFLKNPNHYLFALGAFHYLLSEIQKPHTYWIHNGDFFDDFRTTVRKQLAQINNEGQKNGKLTDDDCMDMDFWDRKLIPTLKKIAPKCLGVVRGNHYRIYGNGDTNVDYISRQAGLKVLGEHRGYLNLSMHRGEKRRSIRLFMTHGSGGAPKNDMGKLKAQTESESASIIFGGHTHDLESEVAAYRKPHEYGIGTHPRIYVRCGTLYIGGDEDYADLIDCSALCAGFGAVTLIPTMNDGNLEVRAKPELLPYNFL